MLSLIFFDTVVTILEHWDLMDLFHMLKLGLKDLLGPIRHLTSTLAVTNKHACDL